METKTSSVALLGIMVLFALGLTVLYIIPFIVAQWKIYVKAGRPGWAAIVPFYSTIVFGKIGKLPIWVAIATIIMSIVASNSNGRYDLLGLASFGLSLYMLIAVAKQFDRGVGFWLLIMFLPIVGVFKVEDATYLGNSDGGSINGQPNVPIAPPELPVLPSAQPPIQ